MPFVQIMGAVNIIIAIAVSGGYMLLALGRAKIMAYSSWMSVLLFTVLAVAAIPQGGAMAIATLRLAVAAFTLVIFIYLAKRELPTLRWLEMLGSVWRPLIAAAVMAFVLLELPAIAGIASSAFRTTCNSSFSSPKPANHSTSGSWRNQVNCRLA